MISFLVGPHPMAAGVQRLRAGGAVVRGSDRRGHDETRASRTGSGGLQLLIVYVLLCVVFAFAVAALTKRVGRASYRHDRHGDNHRARAGAALGGAACRLSTSAASRAPPAFLDCGGVSGIWRPSGEEGSFRSRVDMARYRFGEGEYKYFASPLPPVVSELRAPRYPPLAAVANAWADHARQRARLPGGARRVLARLPAHGQTKPTPLLLRYEAGGYNCLHQDLYGDVAFPLQMTCLLSRPGARLHRAASCCWSSSGPAPSRRGHGGRPRARRRS